MAKKDPQPLNHPYFWLWWIILSVIGTLTLVNIATKIRHAIQIYRLRRVSPTPPSTGKPTQRSLSSRTIDAGIVAWDNVMHLSSLPFLQRFTITETVFMVSYTGLVVGLCFYGTETKATAYANMSGEVAMSQLPLIVGLAGKNAIISYLTGIGSEKFNYLHRAEGRVNFVCVWIHSGYYLRMMAVNSKYKHGWNMPGQIYVRWGFAATIALTLMTIVSVKPVRRVSYELFLYSHIALVAAYLLCAYIHRPEYLYWSVTAMAIWALDRFARVFRILYGYGHMVFFGKGDATAADITPLGDDAVLVVLNRSDMRWRAGQHAYITMPSVSRYPLESHPFTIANTHEPSPDHKDAGKLAFVIKVRDGFTQRLHHHCSNANSASPSVHAILDGPYGQPSSLLFHETVVLVAGGSGITYALSALLEIVRSAREGKAKTKKVVLVWMVKQQVHWEWIQELITPALREIPANLDVQIRIRVTKQAMTEEKRTTNGLNVISYQSTEDILSSLDSAESGKSSPRSGQSPADSVSAFQLPITTTSTRFDEEKMEKGLSKVHPECVTWESGRVKAEELLMEIVKKGMECGMNRTVAVSVCGPTKLKESLRQAVKRVSDPVAVFKGEVPRIELFTESFDW